MPLSFLLRVARCALRVALWDGCTKTSIPQCPALALMIRESDNVAKKISVGIESESVT